MISSEKNSKTEENKRFSSNEIYRETLLRHPHQDKRTEVVNSYNPFTIP